MDDVPDLILRTNEIVITEEIVIVNEIVIVEELRIEVVEEGDDLRVVHGNVLRMVTAEVNFSSATRSKCRVTQWQVGEKE